MTPPPKPPEISVDKVTHHSIEVSWKEQHDSLAAESSADDGRLRVEAQCCGPDSNWEVAYKGFGLRCSCADLQPDLDYQLRYRFGNGHGWGEFSEATCVRTAVKPFSGEDIHRHLRRRDMEQLRTVLAMNTANVNAPNDQGFTPLSVAVTEGLVEFCDLLLAHGADVNWAGDNGKTSLMQAAYKGNLEAIEWLLEHGANLQATDRSRLTALHYAVDAENLEATRLLLERGADPSGLDNKGCTPLLRCAMYRNNGNTSVASVLLSFGAEADAVDPAGQTSLFYCVMHRHQRLAGLLLAKGASPLKENAKGLSPMKVAEGMHDRRIMRLMLQEYLDAKSGQ